MTKNTWDAVVAAAKYDESRAARQTVVLGRRIERAISEVLGDAFGVYRWSFGAPLAGLTVYERHLALAAQTTVDTAPVHSAVVIIVPDLTPQPLELEVSYAAEDLTGLVVQVRVAILRSDGTRRPLRGAADLLAVVGWNDAAPLPIPLVVPPAGTGTSDKQAEEARRD